MKTEVIFVFIFLIFQSCASLRDAPKYQLDDGYYNFKQGDTRMKKVFVEIAADSVRVYPNGVTTPLAFIPSKDEYFIQKSLDVDFTTILFKLRPATVNLPPQMNANFNGNLYMGYRIDRFQVHFTETPAGSKKSYHHRAITVGGFAGLSSTFVSPWTTNHAIGDEYDGLVISSGVSTMVGINHLTVGVALGWDNLLGRDRHVWIYQRKPWLGLSLGLNIN